MTTFTNPERITGDTTARDRFTVVGEGTMGDVFGVRSEGR